MIVLRSPKGWTGPKIVDGLPIEGTFRSHQVPLLVDETHPGHVEQLDSWMRSYKPDELFDQNGQTEVEMAIVLAENDLITTPIVDAEEIDPVGRKVIAQPRRCLETKPRNQSVP